MLFYDPLLVDLFDRQVWLELTYEVRPPATCLPACLLYIL
jgi:hypothetical protein